LARDPRFQRNKQRVENRAELVPVLEALLAAHDGAYWSDVLEKVGVGCGPVNDVAQVLADPQVQHRGLRIDVEHPLAGSMPMIANPLRFSAAGMEYSAPPTLGQHNREILRGLLGLTETEVEDLAADGVI
jgi:crotonobetainyl-CoA:carnitine CoA-transferase CaiB-like acyl-CoA transferase